MIYVLKPILSLSKELMKKMGQNLNNSFFMRNFFFNFVKGWFEQEDIVNLVLPIARGNESLDTVSEWLLSRIFQIE
ncbi:MAG: hypothetical protein ACXAC6_19820 [Candidatus Hodarchaeales archaeon]|jgi:hypothetical protein